LPSLPYPVARLIDAALVGELTVVDGDGRPITYPMIPLLWGERIFMTSTGGTPGRVTIQCDARVSEEDLHAGWERLYHNWTSKDPTVLEMFKSRLEFPLLFERVLIELTPRKTWFWPDGRTDQAPLVNVAAEVAR
jgi:hypothetical protein